MGTVADSGSPSGLENIVTAHVNGFVFAKESMLNESDGNDRKKSAPDILPPFSLRRKTNCAVCHAISPEQRNWTPHDYN